MKSIKIIFLALTVLTLSSCRKKAKVHVVNQISNVTLNDVSFGDIRIGSGLIPGEGSPIQEVYRSDVDFPTAQKVSFQMTANQNTIRLETVETYTLNEGDDLRIVLDDETDVRVVE